MTDHDPTEESCALEVPAETSRPSFTKARQAMTIAAY